MINKRSFLGIPLARRATRRCLVAAFWTLILVMTALSSFWIDRNPNWLDHPFVMPFAWILALLMGFLGGTRPGGPVRDFGGRPSTRPELVDNTIRTLLDPTNREWLKEDAHLDERDVHLRNAAHYAAYTALRWIIFIGFGAALAIQANHVSAKVMALVDPLLLLLLLVAFNLPQSLILWFEPDMEERE